MVNNMHPLPIVKEEKDVNRSILLICAMSMAISRLSKHDRNNLYYFNKTISIFLLSDGVLHAGDLLFQHLLVIGGESSNFQLNSAIKEKLDKQEFDIV
eukprot:8663002-Ditylum_brightwellii.AAC.1